MTVDQFTTIAESSRYNTNNAWGFGGDFGTKFKMGSCVYYRVKRCTRHRGQYKNYSYIVDGKKVERGEFALYLEQVPFEMAESLKHHTVGEIVEDAKAMGFSSEEIRKFKKVVQSLTKKD